MKALNKLFLLVTLTAVVVSCKNDVQPEIKTVEVATKTMAQQIDPNASYAKVEFSIDGMTCAMGCAKTIEKKMAKMEGVKFAKVDFDKELAMVEYDEAKVSPKSLEEAVALVGDAYKVKNMKTVESFSDEKKPCPEDCQKDCCKNKTEAEKMACAENCTKACCAKKA